MFRHMLQRSLRQTQRTGVLSQMGPRRDVYAFSHPVPRKLAEVLHLPKLLKEPRSKINEIWVKHLNSMDNVVPSSFTAKQFTDLQARAKECKMFVVPVHRDGKFFVLVSQIMDNIVLMTDLESYRQNPEAAVPWVVVTCYDELIKAKDLVLYRADLVTNVANLSKLEMVNAVTLWKMAYSEPPSSDRVQMLMQFNKDPASFDMDKYMALCPVTALELQDAKKDKSSVILPPGFKY